MQGKTISGYTIQRLLGTGGMAEVWLAENKIGKKAAVKLLLKKFCDEENVVSRFLTEAKIMVELDHPNIRQVYDYGDIDGRPTIVMEYLEGDDLKARMKRGQRFNNDELVKWWNQLVDALSYTHGKGIIHRDIKPGNIFVDKKGDIKLLDFGIAKVRESISSTQTGQKIGTLMYMSPEQVKDSKHIDYHTDIYSLAVTFVHLLTGRRPYDSDTTSDFDIQLNIVSKPLDLSGVPEDWQRFLAPYLAKNPDERPELCHFESVTPQAEPQEQPKEPQEQPEQPAPEEDEGTIIAGTQPKPEPKKPEPKKPEPQKPEPPKPEPSKTPIKPTPANPKRKTGLWIGIGAIVLAAVIVGLILFGKPNHTQPGNTLIVCCSIEKETINTLAGSNLMDPTFQQAMQLAEERQRNSSTDFLTLLGKAYKEVDPNSRLVSVFLYEFKDKGLNINSTNDEVLRVLQSELDAALDRCLKLLETRIQLYCKGNPELKGVDFGVDWDDDNRLVYISFDAALDDAQMDDVLKLVRSSGNLQFYETYNFDELYLYFEEANEKLSKLHPYDSEIKDENQQFEANYPLFALLAPSYADTGPLQTARMGMAQVKDTAAINQMLAEVTDLFPRNVRFAWTSKPESYGTEYEILELVALKASYVGECAISGEYITDACQVYDSNHYPEITIEMNNEGQRLLKDLTGKNIGRQIAIVMDGYVYSYPVVNSEIPNGRSSISGIGMTVEEAQELTMILKSGMLPVKLYVLEKYVNKE